MYRIAMRKFLRYENFTAQKDFRDYIYVDHLSQKFHDFRASIASSLLFYVWDQVLHLRNPLG